jgi:hypothetical protein
MRKNAGRIVEEVNAKLFELMPFNRDVVKIAALLASMKKYGWISAYPMLVKRSGGGKLTIVDGHHRFDVAQRLGIPFKYVVAEDDELIPTMYELNAAVNKWTIGDFFASYVREGRIEYVEVGEYVADTGIGISAAISLLSGDSAGSCNQGKVFKQGAFKAKDAMLAGVVGDIVKHCTKSGIEWATHRLFVHAVSKIALVPEFSPSIMKHRISTNLGMMRKQATLNQFVEMLDDIYNRQSKKRIALGFKANELARERSATPTRKDRYPHQGKIAVV